MAQTLCPVVSAEDRQRLAAVIGDRNRPQKHVARARAVLFSADRLDVATVARRAGIGRPAVWRWQRRYAEEGVEGCCATRPGSPASRRSAKSSPTGSSL
jgi:transposase